MSNNIIESISDIESEVKSRPEIFIKDANLESGSRDSKYISSEMHDKFYDVLKALSLDRSDACKNIDSLNSLFINLKDAKEKIENLMDCIQVNASLNVHKVTPIINGSFLDKCAGYVKEASGITLIPIFERGGSEEDCVKLFKTLKEEFFDHLPGRFYLGIPKDVGGDHTFRYIPFWLEDVKCAFELQIPQNTAVSYEPLPIGKISASDFFGGIRVGVCSTGKEGWVKEWLYGKDFETAAKNLTEYLNKSDCVCFDVPGSWKDKIDEWNKVKDDDWNRAMDEWKEAFIFWDNLAKKHNLHGIT